MKKRLVMLFMVALVTVGIPKNVEAVSANPNGPVSFGTYGTFATNDITYEYTSTEDGIKEWSYYLTVGSKYNAIYFSLVPTAVEIQSVKAGDGFLIANEGQMDGNNGVKNVLIMSNSSNITSGGRHLLFKVTTKDTAKEGCTLSVSPGSLSCTNIAGSYFDKSGNLLSSESEFKAACEGVTPKPNDVPNANTGSVIPYVAIGGGLAAIAGVYFYSRKAKKMYKI